MEEKKTTYPKTTDNHNNTELTEAANLFSQLSPEMQDAIIDIVKHLLTRRNDD